MFSKTKPKSELCPEAICVDEPPRAYRRAKLKYAPLKKVGGKEGAAFTNIEANIFVPGNDDCSLLQTFQNGAVEADGIVVCVKFNGVLKVSDVRDAVDVMIDSVRAREERTQIVAYSGRYNLHPSLLPEDFDKPRRSE